MYPTLEHTGRYLLNRWVYHVRPPRQGDVVVIRDPVDNGLSVKRIIGQPGDLVELKDCSVFLNGCKLPEPYLCGGTPTYPEANQKCLATRCGREPDLRSRCPRPYPGHGIEVSRPSSGRGGFAKTPFNGGNSRVRLGREAATRRDVSMERYSSSRACVSPGPCQPRPSRLIPS
jgi:signal peptidase I